MKCIFFIPALFIFGSCHFNAPEPSNIDVEITELRDYEIIYQFDENELHATLISPSILTYDGRGNLFVYDRSQARVVLLNPDGDIMHDYGRVGRGPGEFRYVNSIILRQDHIYLVDHWQFFIHKYHHGGELDSSMDYGAYTKGGEAMLSLLSAIVPAGIQPMDINNRPYILSKEMILLPLGRDNASRSIYELRDWQGNFLSDIGEIPEDTLYLPESGGEVYLAAIENREIPGILKPRAFPVADLANSEELFLIFSATGRIEKYDTKGTRLWEREIPSTPEIDAITEDFFMTMQKQNDPANQRQPGTSTGMLKKYTEGVSSPDGELYLATHTDNTTAFSELSETLWIHRFSRDGKLIRRYKLISDTSATLSSVFDFDFTNNRIFTVTSDAEIRAYSFSNI